MLTQNEFLQFKKDYDVYKVINTIDEYGQETKTKSDEKVVINCMWQVLNSELDLQRYGANISEMYYCILYGDYDIDFGDIVIIRDVEYEIKDILYFNTYTQVVVKRKIINNG